MPKIPEMLLNSTFYLYPDADSAEQGTSIGGTGFIVGMPSDVHNHRIFYLYGVTNWHVACAGASVVRLHRRDGGLEIRDFGPDQWTFIPGDDDIAVIPMAIDDEIHRFSFISTEAFATREKIENHGIGVGEDSFMIGRFIDHDGGKQSAPSARFGNISMMPTTGIVRPNGYGGESYCLDMHSRSGYSGSPAFVYRTPGTDFTKSGINLTEKFLYLLGIHWGQFPEIWELKDKQALAEAAKEQALITDGKYIKGLSGMTCVAPAWKIIEVLNLPRFRAHRSREDADFSAQFANETMKPNAEVEGAGSR